MKMKGIVKIGMFVVIVLSWGLVTNAIAGPTAAGPAVQHKKVPIATCPDLSVETIGFRLVEETGPLKWKIVIWGYIKNIGNRDYVPGPLHKALMKFEPAGGSFAMALSDKLPSLAVGKSGTVEFPILWDVEAETNKNRGPFISLDMSDSPGDADPAHKDCNPNNNRSVTLQGSDISMAIKQKAGK